MRIILSKNTIYSEDIIMYSVIRSAVTSVTGTSGNICNDKIKKKKNTKYDYYRVLVIINVFEWTMSYV